MRPGLIFITILLSVTTLYSQEILFDGNEWQNPTIFEINQTGPHAKIIPFNHVEQALTMDQGNSPFFLSLDGEWKFFLAETPGMVPDGFWMPGFDTKAWDNIPVPAHWEMEGYDHPKFRNVRMSIETKPPFVPDYYNPTGCYKRTFYLPNGWDNREILLRFEGVKSASYVWINGQPVGYNQGAFEPAEYNITSFLKSGENEIAVKVLRFSDGSFLENQDMWRVSGIFRSVGLIAKPKVHLHDYFVVTEFDEYYQDADLQVHIDIQNTSGRAQKGYSVEINLLDKHENPVFDSPLIQYAGNIGKEETVKVKYSVPVKQPLKWSAETPDLYKLIMILKDQDGDIAEVTARRIGFRQTEIKDGAIWVNGAIVKFNGVNSHMHHPEHGQAVPLETLRKDLTIMKQFNINLVRVSHYPSSPEYLDLADELGIYIVPDTGNECHDNKYLSADPEWKDQFVDRAVKMVYRDRNHPSVVFWSAGNEAGTGNNLKVMVDVGKEIDPTRQWMYGGNTFYIPFEDIVGPRYWSPLEIKKLVDDKVLDPADQRPSFQDEYLAATGNSLGGLDEYWEQIWKYQRLTGGAIWDWVSPGVKMPLIKTPDASPLKNHPAVMGRPLLVPGKEGQAIRFSGHDDWVEFYRHPDLDLNSDELTIEFWVKPEENLQPNTFITKGSHQFGILQPNAGELEFYVHTNRRYSVNSPIPADWYGSWHHITGIYDGEKIELYINFDKVAESAATGKMQNTPYPLCVGRNAQIHDQGQFSGRLSVCTIDELRVYSRALSISEIKNQTKTEANLKSVASISFEEIQHEGDFFSLGLGGRTYGIIWPDRSIQPEIYQIKKTAQPVLIEDMNIEKGTLRITNRHSFINLNELQGRWEITSDGSITGQGEFLIDCAPGTSNELHLPVTWDENTDNDQWITVSFLLKEDKLWAEAGHEIAWEQFLRPGKQQFLLHSPGSELSSVEVEITNESIVVKGKDFSYVLDTGTGKFQSIIFKGTEMVDPGLDLAIWHAPLANDIDPWRQYFSGVGKFTPGLGLNIENELRTLGLNIIESEVYEINKETLETGEVLISIDIFSTGANMITGFREHREYTFSGDGTIGLSHKIIPLADMPSYLPRIGLDFKLPLSFNHIEWYGRGPFENYPDRKTGAKVGIWSSTVDNEFVPYLMPQAHGNKSDVRWLKISNDENAGLYISSYDLFNFNVSKYSIDNLTRAAHLFQLEKADYVTLSVNYEVTGVGDTSRGTLTKYRVMPSVKEYYLVIRPFKD